MTTNMKTDCEYFEHDSSLSFFKDIKKELVDEILLKENEDMKINFESEIQKVLSGLNLINSFILKNSLMNLKEEDAGFRSKTENQFDLLDKLEGKLLETRKCLKYWFKNASRHKKVIGKISELMNTLQTSSNNLKADYDMVKCIKRCYKNIINYNFETKENIIKSGLKKLELILRIMMIQWMKL